LPGDPDMNKGILLASVLLAILATVLLQMFLDGFIAFIPFMALGLILIFWGFRRTTAP
jgi:MFS superfamily sulfate permease-like transporter